MPNFEIWMCEENFLRTYLLEREKLSLNINDVSKEKLEQIRAINFSNTSVEEKGVYKKDGNTGHIYINGPLTANGPDIFDILLGFGGTGYNDIISAIDLSEENKKTIFHFNTPGGETSLVDIVWNKIKGLKNETESHIDGLLASAGYYIASATDKIISNSPSFEVGSVGVMYSSVDYTDSDKKEGRKKINIRGKNSYNKNLNPSTKDGEKNIQDRVDSQERLMIKRIAAGRGISENTVIKQYGNGNVYPSQDTDKTKPSALNIGMIDCVVNGFRSVIKKGNNNMNGQEEEKVVATEEAKVVATDEVKVVATEEAKVVATEEKKNYFSFAKKIAKSDAYNAPIKNLAIDVITGEVDESALRAAVASFDATMEREKEFISRVEDKKIKHQEVKSQNGNNGVVKSEDDYQNTLDRMLHSRGINRKVVK